MVFANVAKRVRSDHDRSKPNCEEERTSNGIQHEPGSQRSNFPYLGVERYVCNWAKADIHSTLLFSHTSWAVRGL